MTAIAGFWSYAGGEASPSCVRMLKSQEMFGPDHSSQWTDGAVALGRNLFRLLPEDIYDRGPVSVADGRLTLVADVRLDNREELQEALGLCAGRLPAMSDAELLMQSLQRWDEAAVDRIVGDFAFALWDSVRGRLLLARDFLGQRPLHFYRGDGFFAFSSMAKGLHALPQIPYAPNREAIANFLALVPRAETDSFFEGVERVPPGHAVSVSRNSISVRHYWQPSSVPLHLNTATEYAEGLREQLDRAVACRLRGSNGVVAAHLSGGLDSPAATATAARLLAAEDGRVAAFTSVPNPGLESGDDRLIDEGPLAEATAALYPNVEHIKVKAGANSPLRNVDRHFFLFEMPILNLCNSSWSDAIRDEASRRGIRVLLWGSKGNMGASHSGSDYLAKLLRQGRLLKLARRTLELKRGGASWRFLALKTFGPFVPGPLWRRILSRFILAVELDAHSAISPGAYSEFEIDRAAAERGVDFNYRPPSDGFAFRLQMLKRSDVGTYNKGVLAGWGVDQRDPTADRRLIEFCLRVPAEQFTEGGMFRSLARRAFADRLPEAVIKETRTGYQAADWHLGVVGAQSEIREELGRIAGCKHASGLLDLQRLTNAMDSLPTDGWSDLAIRREYRHALLRGVSAGHFMRRASRTN